MKHIIHMAWRNIWRNKLRSAAIITSVGIGIICGISVMSFYKGIMRSRVKTLIESEVGHIQIHKPSFKMDENVSVNFSENDSIIKLLSKDLDIKAFCIRSLTNGMIASAIGTSGIQVTGIDTTAENKVSRINEKIIKGKTFTTNKNEIIISQKIAKKLKLTLGKKCIITFTDKDDNLISAAFRICGIYETVNAPLDEKIVYVKYQELNELLGIGNNFHEITVILKNDELVNNALNKYQNIFPFFQIESWKELSPETNLMVDTIDVYAFIVMIIILLALSFGIINTMLMAILERTKEIAMMTALGLNKIKLFILIMLETLFLTLIGSPLGIIISFLLISFLKNNGINLTGSGNEMMESFGFESIIYPEFPYEKLLPVFLLVIATAILSCIFPAFRAMKLQPSEGLRK